MKSLIYSHLIFLSVLISACKHGSTDSVVPTVEKPVVTVWTNIDSLVNLTDHTALGAYADSLGIVFMDNRGFTFLKKGSHTPVHYEYPLYDRYGNVQPTFFKGMAYVITSENTIKVFSYGNAINNSFTIQLSDLNLPVPFTDQSRFSVNAPIFISSKRQMVVQVNVPHGDQVPITLQLDAMGKPVQNATGIKLGHPIALPDSTCDSPFYSHYIESDQLFVTLYRDYTNSHLIINGLLGELQRVTTTGTLETVLPFVVTKNLFSFKNALYAIAGNLTSSIYKSTNAGKSWLPLNYPVDIISLSDYISKFYTIDNRLIVAYRINNLLEFDIENGQTKALSLAGIPDTKREISGLVEYEGFVYLTTSDSGIYRKLVKDL